MPEQHRRFPENLVTAVLHRAGLPEINDSVLTQELGLAAQTSELFAEFSLHPQYHDSLALAETLGNLHLGGSIIREGLTTRIRPSSSVLGEYGKILYGAYTPAEQLLIDGVANALRGLANHP